MALFKCKMCGGALEINSNESVAVCEYCGTQQTLPKLDDDRKANLYDRANHFRRNNEFDKAMSIYENILNEDKTDAESYWSLVLCRYGIEYVEDPASHKRVPTVNRAQFTSVFDDDNYKSALQYADSVQKSIYEAEAKAINEIQKGILEISQKEEPFDVFICYKETDNNGRRTPDSVLATELYHELIKEGFKVFFSRITLEDKLGTAYEPYIFAALNSASVMVALGTKQEYFNAVWVKNEWSRYLSLIKSGAKKTLIPAFKDMDPYDLPEEFSHLQAQDMSKLGFMQDLIRGIKKIVAADEPAPVQVKETIISTSAANVAPLLKRVFMFLEDGDWNSANEYCEKVLDIEPECAEAYLGKLMAELNVKKRDLLSTCNNPFDTNANYQKIVRFGNAELKAELEGYISTINERNENNRLMLAYNNAISAMNAANNESKYKLVAASFKAISNYKDSAELAEKCLEKAEEARLDAIYNNAKSKMDYLLEDYYNKAIDLFKSIPGWKDSDELVRKCEETLVQIKERAEAGRLERERKSKLECIEAEKRAKKIKKILITTGSILVSVIAILLLFINIVIPSINYSKAEKLLEAGKYENAVYAFNLLAEKKFKDSEKRIIDCKTAWYNYALKLASSKKYTEAISEFEKLEDFKDSDIQQKKCQYEYAIILYEEKKYVRAIEIVESLGDFENASNRLKEIKINYAKNLFDEGKYEEAKKIFDELNTYEDAKHCSVLCDDKINGIDAVALKNTLKNVKVNSVIKYGRYENMPIEWIVLEKKDGKVLLLSKYVLCNICYDDFESYQDYFWHDV